MIKAQQLLLSRYATGCETDSKKLPEVCDGQGQQRLTATTASLTSIQCYENSMPSGLQESPKAGHESHFDAWLLNQPDRIFEHTECYEQ